MGFSPGGNARSIYEMDSSGVCELSLLRYRSSHSPQVRKLMVAALIAISDAPLRVGALYEFEWNGKAISGHIRSIVQRLHSPVVTQGTDVWLGPKELAFVEIELSSSNTLPAPVYNVERLQLVERATKQTIGRGLIIPDHPQEGNSNVLAASDGLTVWLTGLSGSGKTTIAQRLQDRLHQYYKVEILDGDIVRTHLCQDLGYSREDRNENVRRLGFVAALLSNRGTIVMVPAISPYRDARNEVRSKIGRFVEVYVNAPLATCESRDVKGLYKKARAGEIQRFTGIDDPYEPPLAAEVECHTDSESIDTCVSRVLRVIEQKVNPVLGWAVNRV